jgi:HTH-type transcriptional regulator/antitoxin HigA
MNIKVIKHREDYAQAMARLSALMDLDPKPGSDEEDELDLLALVIEDYERKIVPPAVPDPIEAILFRMDQAGLTRKELIPYIGSASKVSEVLSRKRPLSLAMIRNLHNGLGIPAGALIGGENGSQILLANEPEADYARFPLKEMNERGYFSHFAADAHRLKDYAEELMRGFFQDLSPANLRPALLRAPLHQRGARTADGTAMLAWRLCVLKKARAIDLSHAYEKGTVTPGWLRDLAKLSALSEGPNLAREYLANAGIALVIEPHFKGTYLDGAAMLDQGRPIVALTLRHDRLDNYWFALLHELAHVAKHLDEAHPVFTDDLDSTDEQDRKEREADEMATNALIPPNAWEKAAVRESHAPRDAQALARQLGIHPAIVAGRVRHETRNYRVLARLLGQGEPGRQLANPGLNQGTR